MSQLLLSMIVLFLLLVSSADSCFPILPVHDNAKFRTATPCTVVPTPFGTFNPAPGSTIPHKSVALLTCDPVTYFSSTPAILTATCSNGVLSTTTECLPCPDATWVYDSTTNRCFKSFPAIMPFFPCNPTLYCANVGSPYGLPSDIGYTLNLPVLIEAGTRGLQQFSVASYVGISDAAAANNYQLKDGTPVPSSDLLPLWCPGWPTDGANGLTYMLVAYTSGAAPPIGFKDASCLFAFRAVCQIQL